jgi:membrane associated rhomboid family serine protease
MRGSNYRWRVTFRLPFRRADDRATTTEPPFDPSSWTGALLIMAGVTAGLWVIQIANAEHDYSFNRFGLKPREVDGLWGVLTQPFLHEGYRQMLSATVPLLAIGWALLLSGIRVWTFVTAFVVVVGGLAAWLVGPSGTTIVGASSMVFGWLGYLIARAYFSRRFKWIVIAAALLIFFGTWLGGLVPHAGASWQAHLCGFLAGVLVGWLLHPRRVARDGPARRAPVG